MKHDHNKKFVGNVGANSASKRNLKFGNGSDRKLAGALNPNDPARSGHHVLDTHPVTSLHDGDDEMSESAEARSAEVTPVGPRQKAKSSRGY